MAADTTDKWLPRLGVIGATVVVLGLMALGWRSCEQLHTEDMARIKEGQVYVNRGWVLPASATVEKAPN